MVLVDTTLDEATEAGGKERLISLFSRVSKAAEDAEQTQTLYMLEYILQGINTRLEKEFGISLEWNNLIDLGEDVIDKEEEIEEVGQEREETQEQTNGGIAEDPMTSYNLTDFYATYKSYVTSTTPISDLCTTYYDKIDAVAKEYDFPTALIIATWYKEHTCIFDNPSNGWGNFQITSHYYPAGAIDWAKFENQIINFIIFSRAKREYYDDVQSFGPESIELTYDTIDLTSLRKHAIFYNGISGTLESNSYANQNFGRTASGRDGIVAMTIRALGWQLYGDQSDILQGSKIVDVVGPLEEEEDEIEQV